MGDIRAGSVASFGPVATVVVGGLAAFSVAIGGWYYFQNCASSIDWLICVQI